MFFQLEAEHHEPSAARFRWAAKKYSQFVTETNASYPELETDKRFFLTRFWESDALIKFNEWLATQELTSRTQYSLYKTVRQVMDTAYALRITDTAVYHAPMFIGVSETAQRSAYGLREQEVINASLARWIGLANSVLNGYTPTGEGIPYRPKRFDFSDLVIGNRHYTVSEAATQFGLTYMKLSEKLRTGWTVRQAVGLEPRYSNHDDVELVIEGVKYSSITAAAIAYGQSPRTVGPRVRKGFTPEQCVGLAPMYVSRRDERALLWMFENRFDGDALAMYEHFYGESMHLNGSCTLSDLMKFFIRWGVWPYVDDRIVMPLATELSMLTGLNVESLKELTIDSYQPKHRLTGQPVILYTKLRAASNNRPAERELHLPLLEMEELYLDESVVERVEKIIGLTLALTQKIRSDAPDEIAKRLFIFEDVDRSWREGSRAIVPIDPKGKTATWYERFCADEGFHTLFGNDFRFNIARCRPTLATNMVLAGATLFEVQVVLGHASIQSTATYLDGKNLKPAFNRSVSEALENIVSRSRDFMKEEHTSEQDGLTDIDDSQDGFHETLSGCGCRNPYNPSKHVRKLTKYKKGTVCKYWNMCLRCDSAIVTEQSLPKIIVYRRRVEAALETGSPAIRSRKELFEDAIKLIDGILEPDVVFPANIIRNAEYQAATMDDVLVDHLIYQGL
ncbi:hypothetical protein [Paraburkholderia sp. RL17-337-BIB-A]|uniref:hypothetical protein n=1 Tax=Paraburkholderia sp. RL17-337-BIB-A TaxID=3031636 RepID=UPI0038BB4C33